MKAVDGFYNILEERNEKIDNASASEIATNDPVRELASTLHPRIQHLRVREVREGKDAKSYILEPVKGAIAPFAAGEYLSIRLRIGTSVLTRAYSISSGPLESLRMNAYMITVKRTHEGFASSFILDEWKVGSEVESSAPEGTFTYEMVRDAKSVIAIAGGSGITPFRSMASSIADCFDDYSLTILYGSRTEEDILFKEELEDFMKKSDKVKVVHVLSDEKRDGYEHGFITTSLIAKYLPSTPPFSFFICGPEALYRFIASQIAPFSMPSKYIRYEMSPFAGSPDTHPSYPEASASGECNLTVRMRWNEYTIRARRDETILTAIERAGILAPSSCRSGECGLCRSLLLSGDVFIPQEKDERRKADVKYGFIHPCVTFPLGDLVIEVPSAE